MQTQVVAYLAGLARRGHRIHLLTFETEQLTSSQKRLWQKRLKEQGIYWHHLKYHKTPSLPATVYDVLCGIFAALRIIRRHRLNTVHARSHVPATMGLILKILTGCRLIFDIRGLLAEEYVDAGNWRQDGMPFRLTKVVEKRCIDKADGIVVLTERVKRELFGEDVDPRVHVIPCCADLTQIERQATQRTAMRVDLGVDDKIVMIYAGKFGGWYMAKEMVAFFHAAREVINNLHFVVLTQSDQDIIREEFALYSTSPTDYTITRAEPNRVGEYLAAADFSIAFYKCCPSIIACSPTKIGEYLAAGLPIVSTGGIGDVDAIITDNQVGAIVRDFTAASFRSIAQHILDLVKHPESRQHCRQLAHSKFSLEAIGIPRYCALYEEVAQSVVR